MANEFVVKNGLIVSGSTNVSGSVTAFSFTGSFSGSFTGSIASPGSTTQILFNSGGLVGTDTRFVFSGSRLGVNTSTPFATAHITQYDPTLPALPAGYQFLIDQLGQYLVDSASNYLIGADPVNYASASFIVDSLPFTNVIFVSGNRVGINTGLATEALDVVGNVKAYNFLGTASSAVSSSYALQATSASYVNGTVVAPGSNFNILQNIGGNIGTIGNFQYEIIGSTGTLSMTDGDQLTFIGPSGPFLTTNGPTGVYRFTQGGQQYIELNDTDQTLRLAAGGTVIATVDASSQGMGVGIPTPTARLHVKGTGNTSSTTALKVVKANTSSSFTVLDDGKVGVGNDAPLASLHILENSSPYSNIPTGVEFLLDNNGDYLLAGPGQPFLVQDPTDYTGAALKVDSLTGNLNVLLVSGSKVDINGDTTISGSLTVSGSSTFTNIGPAIFSGSVTISGSTSLFDGASITGSTVITGSTSIIGNIDQSDGEFGVFNSNTGTGVIKPGLMRIEGNPFTRDLTLGYGFGGTGYITTFDGATGQVNFPAGIDVTGSITNNGVNLQSLMIAYSIALG
jgi:hypothetical protein